jgi:cytochrome P450
VFQLPIPADVGAGVWLLTRYAEVHAALRDNRLSADRRKADAIIRNRAELPRQFVGDDGDSIFRSMLMMDAPDHSRIRGLVNKAFTPRRVSELRPHVERIAEQLLAEPARRGELEVIGEFSSQLPAIVIAELLGVPVEDHQKFRSWAAEVISAPALVASGGDANDSARSFEALAEYLRHVIVLRRAEPKDDLLSALVAAQEDRDALTEQELVATAILILIAGHETTTNLIGNGLLALLQYPDQLRRLYAEPELLKTGIEEMLRWDSPVQATGLVALEDVVYGDKTLAKGAMLITAIGAANRDPAVFENAETFDVGREDNRHLSFGFGAHFCLGASLARMEGEIAFRALFQKFPKLELAEEKVEHRVNPFLRGLKSLRVTGC